MIESDYNNIKFEGAMLVFSQEKYVLPFVQELIKTMNNSPQTTVESSSNGSPVDWSDSIATDEPIELMDNSIPIFVNFLECNALEDLEMISQCFMDEKVESADQLEFIKSLIYLGHYDLASTCCISSLNDNLAKYSVCKYLMEKGEYDRSTQILKTMKDPYVFYGQKELLKNGQAELVTKELGLLIKRRRTNVLKARLIKRDEVISKPDPKEFAIAIRNATTKRNLRADRNSIVEPQEVSPCKIQPDDSYRGNSLERDPKEFAIGIRKAATKRNLRVYKNSIVNPQNVKNPIREDKSWITEKK